MSVKLSHTAKQMYMRSPRSYFYHYMLYLRPKVTKSALFFGSILEKGIDALLQGKSLEDAKKIFASNFEKTEVNGKIEDLKSSENIEYSKADTDESLIPDEYKKKTEKEQSWFSLREKGYMLLEAYAKDVLPNIKRVIATQIPINVKNESGDTITGFADLICEWIDGRVLLIDHKTTSVKYPEDATNTEEYGEQTALYYDVLKEQYKIDAVGFFVLEKKIRKKEPKARVYWTEFQVPNEKLIQKTFDNLDEVCYNIKQGNFPCAAPNCDAYGQKCCYKKYCESGGTDLTGLVKLGFNKTK